MIINHTEPEVAVIVKMKKGVNINVSDKCTKEVKTHDKHGELDSNNNNNNNYNNGKMKN